MLKRVIATPTVYPRFLEFLHVDIQSTGRTLSRPWSRGVQTLRTQDTSDLPKFGMTEVSRHFGTGAEVSYGHFGTRQSQYLQRRPTTLHIMQRPARE